jgi:hypothetical protein
MVNSSAIWITSEFFKEHQSSTRTSAIWVLWKLTTPTSVCFIQISREPSYYVFYNLISTLLRCCFTNVVSTAAITDVEINVIHGWLYNVNLWST